MTGIQQTAQVLVLTSLRTKDRVGLIDQQRRRIVRSDADGPVDRRRRRVDGHQRPVRHAFDHVQQPGLPAAPFGRPDD